MRGHRNIQDEKKLTARDLLTDLDNYDHDGVIPLESWEEEEEREARRAEERACSHFNRANKS